jgi:hypothetical protein
MHLHMHSPIQTALAVAQYLHQRADDATKDNWMHPNLALQSLD